MDHKKSSLPLPFLLAQVGAHAAMRFGERLAVLRLTPADCGILWMLNVSSGVSQQALSARLGLHPSRLVAILDELENRSLVERKPNVDDRRQHALHLTDRGKETLSEISGIAREHRENLCASLSNSEQEILAEMLNRIAQEQGLKAGVHPGFQRMKPPK
jgi:DNA-binding MarR family transcriptional regulator